MYMAGSICRVARLSPHVLEWNAFHCYQIILFLSILSVISHQSFIYLHSGGSQDGVVVDKLEGANPPELAHKLSKLATDVTKPEPASQGLAGGTAVLEVLKKELPPASDTPPTVNGIALKDSLPEVEKSELHKLVNSNPIMLFMKGTPEEPKCGFSRKVVAALKDEGVQFDSFNVLSDETVRQGIKTFSNWPTFPQLYVMGELLGGCDIVLEMHKSGELKQVHLQLAFCFWSYASLQIAVYLNCTICQSDFLDSQFQSHR